MEPTNKTAITVETLINAPLKKAWEYWNEPKHITQWYQASADWHAPNAENDLQVNGKFKTTMAAKDGSMRFDFEGVYTNVQPNKAIEYTMNDGRKVSISFSQQGDQIKLVEIFEAESINPLEMQQSGWQAILDSFKHYIERSR